MVAHYAQCLNAVADTIFPQRNKALSAQKRHLREVRLHNNTTINEFFAQWQQMNNYLEFFPPYGREDQKLPDDEIVGYIYNCLPRKYKSDLEKFDFDIYDTTLMDFRAILEHLELSYALDDSNKPESNNKSNKNNNGKKLSGKKHSNDSKTDSKKYYCMLHGDTSNMGAKHHKTSDCCTLKQQAKNMQATWEAQFPSEHQKKQHEQEKNKPPSRNEIQEMIKESVQEMFQTHIENNKKRSHNSDSKSDSDNENFCVNEDLNLDLDEVNVSEEMLALSDLRKPARKRKKTNHLTPVTTASINTQLRKSRYKKFRILLDSRSSGSIIIEQFDRKLHLTNDTKTNWSTKSGNFQMSKKCKPHSF